VYTFEVPLVLRRIVSEIVGDVYTLFGVGSTEPKKMGQVCYLPVPANLIDQLVAVNLPPSVLSSLANYLSTIGLLTCERSLAI